MLIRRDGMTPDGMLLSAEEAQSWAWTFFLHLTSHPSLDLGAAPERRCRRPTLAGHPGDGWDPAACARGPSPSFLGVAVHEAKVTSAEKSIERRRYSPDASVDPTDARKATVRRFGRSDE